MKPQTEKQNITFLRRADPASYLENQTVTIPTGGGTDTIENLLIGTDLLAYECEIEGKRVVLLGFEAKN